MRAALPSSAPSRPEPGPAAGGLARAGGRLPWRDLGLALLVALAPVLLYARTLGWPALEATDSGLALPWDLAGGARGPGALGLALDPTLAARALAVALFAGTSALAYGVARTLGLRRAASALVALLFALNPLQVESVAWLSQHDTRLGGACFLLGTCLGLRGSASRSLAALAAFALALSVEPRLLGGLVWLVLAERWAPIRRPERLRLVALLALGAWAIAWLVPSVSRAGFGADRAAEAPLALGALGWHVLVPGEPTPRHGVLDAATWVLALGWLALALALGGLLRLARRRPRLALGLLWFVLLGAGPVLFPRGEDLFRESDAHLALLGLALALAAGTEQLVRPGLLFGAALGLAWTLRTQARLEAWRSEPALQAAALAARPDDARAHEALARWHLAHGRVSAAQAASERALAPHPDDPAALLLRAEIELRRGRVREEPHLARAAELLERALGAPAPPRVSAACRVRRAELHRMAGEPGRARELLEQALQEDPGRAEAQALLGRVELDLGELARARTAYRRALELDPRASEAWYGLGLAALRADDAAEAAAAFERALELEPDLIEAHARLGRLRESAGDRAGAEAHYRRALAVAPDRGDALQIDTLYALGALLSASGRGEEALRYLERVVALSPSPPHVRAHLESARLHLARGEHELARRRVAAVLAHNPAHPEALALEARLASEAPR